MRYTGARFTTGLLTLSLIIGCSGCTKINLSGSGKGPQQPNPIGGQPSGPGQPQVSSGAPPPLEGEWEIDFTVPGGEPQISNVTFAQTDKALAGEGADQSGTVWRIQDGVVNGTNVTFSKVYDGVDPPRPPINYIGQLKFEQSPEFTGWLMEGTYSVKRPDGSTLSGKWVSNPVAGAPQEAEQPPPLQLGQSQQPVAAPPAPATVVPDNIGTDKPTDLSGKYHVSYQYNFKKVMGHMWLEHDGGKLGGHGADTTTGESYTLEGGKYNYPDISFVRSYVKGKGGAKVSRKVVFRARISSDGHMIIMKGETQFGGQWDAKLARLR